MDRVYSSEIEALERHISGEKPMSREELDRIDETVYSDSPYSDDWISYGYSSRMEWYEAHKDWLNSLDRMAELCRKAKRTSF